MTLSAAEGASINRYRVTDTTHGPYKNSNLARYFISLRDDGTNTPQQLLAAFELLEDICRTHAKTGILVHCQAPGLSRSVSLVAALVAKSLKCSFEEAVRSLALHRHVGIHEDLALTLTHATGIQLDKTQ
jgi:protein-tyrosine phosphatase